MRKLLFCTVLFLFAVSRLAAQNTDTAAVKQVFQSYMELADANDGKTLSGLISQSTVDYYAEILRHVRFSKKKKVKKLDFIEKMTVLITRQLLDRSKARELGEDGKRFFEFLVDNKTVNSEKALSLGKITFKDNIATCEVVHNGKALPENLVTYKFVWEEEQWKIDIPSIINNPFIQLALRKAVKELEMTELEFILFAMKMTFGDALNEKKIWKPTK